MRTILLLIIFINLFRGLTAQERELKNYTKSTALGVHFYTFGWGFDLHQTFKASEKREHIFKFDISSLKNKNESRNPSIYRDQGGKAYIYGKTHYCYNLGLTYGQQWNLIPKGTINHISLKMGISGGFALAMLKPYFVEVINTRLSRIDVDQYSSSKYSINDIVGESDFFQGFERIKLLLGLRCKVHSSLDLGQENFVIRAIYTGIQADIFSQRPPIMDTVYNPQFFFSLFLGFMIGNNY
jgi:hypothetical protein